MGQRDRALLLVTHIVILAAKVQRGILNDPEVDDSILAGLSNAADQLLDIVPDDEGS